MQQKWAESDNEGNLSRIHCHFPTPARTTNLEDRLNYQKESKKKILWGMRGKSLDRCTLKSNQPLVDIQRGGEVRGISLNKGTQTITQ